MEGNFLEKNDKFPRETWNKSAINQSLFPRTKSFSGKMNNDRKR